MFLIYGKDPDDDSYLFVKSDYNDRNKFLI